MQPLKSFRKLRSEFRSLLFKLLERFQLEISYLLLFVGCALFLLTPHVLSESYYVDEKSLMPGDVRTTRSDSYFRSLKGNVRDLLLEINEHSEMELMEFPNGSLLLQVPSFSSRNGETFLFHTFFDCELSLRALLRIARSHVGTLHQRLHLSIAVTAPLPEAYDTLIDELLRRGYVITAALTLDVCRGYKAEKNDLFAVDAFGFHGHQPKFDYVVTVAQEFQKHVSGSTMIGNPERILNFSSRFDWFSFWIPEEIFQRTTHYFASLLSMIDLPSLRSSHAYFKEYAIPAVTVRNFSVHEVGVKPRHEFEISRALDEVLRRVHNIEMRINRSEPLWFIVDNMNFISDGRAQICRYLLVVAIGFLGVAQTHQRSESESTTRRFVVLAFITGSSLLSLLSGSSEFLSLFTTMAQILMSGFVRWHFPVRTTTSLAAFSAMVAIVTITGMNAALATFSSVTFSLILILTFMWRSKLLLRTLVALILSPSLICFLVEPISESDLDLFMRILYVPIYSMTLMIPSGGVDQSSPTREHTFERNGGESLVVKKRM